MTLTNTSSPTDTTCSASSTCLPESSEMCTRPSMPSATRTNAPNGTSLVTLPGATWPMACVRAKTCHGSSCVALSDSETRSRSRSTSRISTVTSWPTSTTSLACSMCFQLSSETCTRPSTPPRSTNAPKLTIEETTPLRTWPFWRLLRNVLRLSDCVCSRSARRDRTTLLRFLSSSRIFASISWPRYGVRSRTRRSSMSEAGRKPRRPMSTMRPPLTTSMTVPVTTPSDSLIFSTSPHARSYCARFLDRIRRPSLSSFWRTRASTVSPTLTTSVGSTSCLIDSSREGMTPSVL
ncbi:hypothetical protein BC477_13255 [Clavibacter michiganensis subsp. michiganensis]|uniref:Uncharacterized protein n=1 Tax=Clavibacter michiganensis subsp. michiganensis TaxID=33013 RepID=A0A251XIN3_CLAMM|nr:hypothetical protein BC477_13255 [Clavibacter michiganensis subsp. michiganensis]OUE02763.1 hypothetical protein CMMCAS07_12160 [Clavibacter michiganensis subsp. michiganensis]